MAKKPTIASIASGYQSTTTINSNMQALRDAFDNTLSLDGSIPNAMQADLDMNNNDILNVNTLTTEEIILDGTPFAPFINVENNINDIINVSNNMSSITTVSTNTTNINITATNITSVQNFSNVYLGAHSSDPTTRTNGSSLQVGDMYFNTTINRMKSRGTSGWYTTDVLGATDASLVSYSPATGSAVSTETRLREFDVLIPPTALNRGFSNSLPLGSVSPTTNFNDTLKLNRHYNGSEMVYLQDPFDVIDFTKNPDTTINTYYVNYTTGNNANAGTSSGAAWKTLTKALTTAVSPAVIVVEDAWVGQNSLLSTSNTLNGKFKFVSGHASGRTLFTNMNESYTKATFNWLDETSGCWSTSTATTTATIFGRLGLICFDSKYRDDRGRAMPLPQAASAAACISTPGTQFLDVAASKKYVHLIDGRTPDPYDGFIYGANLGGVVFLQSANDGVILFENFHSYMNAATAPLAGFRYRHSTTATNASIFGARNCIACGASSNGFEIYDADVAVLSNCSAAYNRTDNFNYHSFQSTGTRGEYMTVYEYKCDGLQPGYNGFINQPTLSASSNSSTCHDSIHIERTSCNHGGGNGATIADVNGCVSVNWCVNVGPPTGGSPKSCFWQENYLKVGTYNGMYLWGCSAHDNQDGTIKLITNEAQAGGSANDGQIYIKYWRGKTGGVVTGTLKDFSGSTL